MAITVTVASPADVSWTVVSSSGIPKTWPRISGRSFPLVDEAVGIARRIPALETRLMHPHPAKVIAVREKARVDAHATAVRIGINARHPGADPFRIEDVIPARIERVRGIHAATVPADLHHLRPASQPQIRRGVRSATHDAAEMYRPGLAWVVRVADVILLELFRSPARHVQPAVVDRQVDIRHQWRDRAERLPRPGEPRCLAGRP